ncbi:MAG TPA: DUF4352 domain-containing protein [Bryobacteraceae bacterium]|jgi:hypothetical protein
MLRLHSLSCIAVVAAILLTGCSQTKSARLDYQMGEKIPVGLLTYDIVQTSWKTQLGEAFQVRFPQNRFLLVDISVTNGGGSDISVPLFTLEDANGQSYPEASSGEGVDNWFGLLRNISPAQTQQGRLVFDVPLTSYKLRITDGGGPGEEKFAWVTIPLRMDVDSTVQSPTPGTPVQ